MTAPQSGGPSARLMLRGLGWDVGLPVLGYYALHLAGVSDLVALLVASALAAARIVWVAERDRELNPFATVMLVVFGIGLILALASGDPRFLLLKNSIVTGVLGLVFLGTTLFGTPLTLAASQSFQPARKAELRHAYDTNPHVRHGHRLCSTVWGVGLVLEALIRVPLVFLLPISVMVGLGELMTIAVIGGLLAWNIWYVKRATARGQAAG